VVAVLVALKPDVLDNVKIFYYSIDMKILYVTQQYSTGIRINKM